MTCKQLGGACDFQFKATTFHELTELSRIHVQEMLQHGEPGHIQAVDAMVKMMQNSDEVNHWVAAREAEFHALPECMS